MTEKKKYAYKRVTAKTGQQISDISKILGKTEIRFLEKLVGELWELVATYRQGANLTFESRVTSGILNIMVTGSSRIIHGSFDDSGMSDKEVDAEISKRLKEQMKEGEK